MAQAEESSGIQYETDVPNVPNNENIPSDKDSGKPNTRDEPDAETSDSDPQTGGAAGGNDGSGTGGGANPGQGNQGAGDRDGKAADGSKPAGGELKDAKPITSFDSTAAPASDDDGSSPLVPILIAIAVLAAISVGAFLYRQRRQDPTSPISPKAS